jgi:acyl carrier protein
VDDMEIDDRLVEIFRTVFENDDLQLTASMSAADVEGWDSVAHITLILQLKKNSDFNSAPVSWKRSVTLAICNLSSPTGARWAPTLLGLLPADDESSISDLRSVGVCVAIG